MKCEISFLLITKNEAHNIAACLDSLKWAKDVIVLDSASTDQTVQIAKSYANTQVHEVEWQGYSETKQNGIQYAKHDWIFWIDADERVDEELKQFLVNFNPTHDEDVVEIKRLNYFLGKAVHFSGWQNEWVVRLFHKNKSRFDGKEVHEKIEFSGQSYRSKGQLHHHTYKDINHYFSKFQQYTDLGANQKLKQGKRVSFLDLVLKPHFRFFRHYWLRFGILDGKVGLIVSVLSALGVFVRDLKVYFRQG
jgi:glycosyltransferase involved in cell wall biosynthesis